MNQNHNGVDIKNLQIRMDYVEKGISKTEEALNKRLESMNEFRQSLKDQTSTYITRNEYEVKHQLICEKIELVQKLVWIGMGLLLAVEVLLRFVK